MAGDKDASRSTPLGKPGGLYDQVKLDRAGANRLAVISLGLLVVIFVLVIAFGRTGFTVRFDANGGTDVESVKLDYGGTLPAVPAPTREGYTFTGWYQDPYGSEPWGREDPVTEDVTLYAGWEAEG